MKRYLLLLIPLLCSFRSVAQSDYKYHTDDSLLNVWSHLLFRDPLLSDEQRGKVWGDSITSYCKSRNMSVWSSPAHIHANNDTDFMYVDTALVQKQMAERKRGE
jgi:hypothetical protein